MITMIPGYRCEEVDGVYARSRDVIKPLAGGIGQTDEVLILGRYIQPVEDDVVKYFINAANRREEELPVLTPVHDRTTSMSIGDAIRKIPDKYLKDIRNGDDKTIEFIRKTTSAPAEEEARRCYLELRYGLIADEDRAEAVQERRTPTYIWYLNNLNEEWRARMLLSEGTLPRWDDMETFLRCGVTSSDKFSLDGNYRREDVSETIRAVHRGLSGRQIVEEVPDIGMLYLGMYVAEPLSTIYRNLERLDFLKGIAESLHRMQQEIQREDKQ